MKLSIAQICRRAAKEIKRRGLHKGWFYSDLQNLNNCSVCAEGALRCVIVDNPARSFPPEVWRKLLESNIMEFRGVALNQWNDSFDTTPDDVIRYFRNKSKSSKLSKIFVEIPDNSVTNGT